MSGRLILTKLLNRRILLHPQVKNYSTSSTQWDIFASVCVERLPIVTPPLSDQQKEYQKYLLETEINTSYKSNHELRIEKDKIFAEKSKSDSDSLNLDEVAKETAQEYEDLCNDEYASFICAPIETEADKKNDQKSLERKLQSHLVLLVEQQLGNDKKFALPQGKHIEGETLRQTAERVFKETCGDGVDVRFFGNAPCGYYRYKWKSPQGTCGAKVFFYYAQHLSGQISKSNYKWMSRNELKKALLPEYYNSINDFLVDERL